MGTIEVKQCNKEDCVYEMITTLDKRLYKIRDKLLSVVLEDTGYKSKYSVTKMELCVNCFVHNTIKVNFIGKTRSQITLDNNHYSRGFIQNGVRLKSKVSLRYTKLMLGILEKCNYIILVKGGREYSWDLKTHGVVAENICTYLEYLPKLQMLYDKYKSGYQVKLLKNVIELRDENKLAKTFKTTSQIKVEKASTLDYNLLTITTDVTESKNRSYNCQVKKIYNVNFETGGRSYMGLEGIQNLSKQERRDLMIRGNDTVIYDYKSFEPSIAYSINQELMKCDPYQLDWKFYDTKFLRDLGKLALTTMLYAGNKQSAILSCSYEIGKKFDIDKLYEEGKIPNPLIDTKQLIEDIEKRNSKILDLLYKQTQNDLSNLGSKIMDYIMNYFTQRGILVLPVFDEVIIEAEFEDKLKEVMEMAYESVLGFTDNCHIRKEK